MVRKVKDFYVTIMFIFLLDLEGFWLLASSSIFALW